ncbi:MAG: DNA mismatch repair endonuclease MutL [Lachnospiraceae bacterium]|nr:DNA mismatch repair endonuclease MutL [Lachnospiraceae bacterium]
MPQINLLSQNTIDQIAAGEVVERPLSVVKELTENAIDAGADAIAVEIKEGGISLIRVTDNGCGIEKDQVRKAFLRHATSKITTIDDLSHTKSLGFRGEALSSIAAVSQVEVITKTADSLTGIRYAIAGGEAEEPEEVGAPEGTTFLVHNLFYNTPARKKFLKQPQTEGGYVADMMEHLALSHPHISIKFVNNGQLRFQTSGNGDLKEVIYRIYGRDMAEALIPFSLNGQGFSVSGFLGKPECNRSNRNFETGFVNGRYVKSDLLMKAMEEGYRTYLMQHKFPFYVLHFELDPDTIDVNVHPSKMEIRIHQGAELYKELSNAVFDHLKEQELIPDVKLVEEPKKAVKEASKEVEKSPEPFEINRMQMIEEEKAKYHTDGPKVTDLLQKTAPNRIIGSVSVPETAQNAGMHSNLRTNVIKAADHILVEKPVQLDLFEEHFLSKQAKEEYQILGQVFQTYFLVAFKDRLFIIDQHAAHEKVKYERLVKELEAKSVSAQMINPPVVITLTGKEEEVLLQMMENFKALGFEIEAFGSGSYVLRGMPADLYGCSEKEFFMDILDEIADNPMKGTPDVILHKLASMACKAAVKGNHEMAMAEAEALIDELLTLEDPYHCPHGRPTIISMTKYEMEKKFKRIV